MSRPDIRWKQRFENYTKAVEQMTRFIEAGELNEMEEQGLIQSFEYTYELAWNTLKDFFEEQGETQVMGSRDAFRLAFKRGLIEEGEVWMDMIKSRNQTSHTDNEETANQITEAILTRYCAQFSQFSARFARLQEAGS